MPNNQFGDFQTPPELALKCLTKIPIPSNGRVFEPTCGTGAFLQAAKAISPNTERRGVEINAKYAEVASKSAEVDIADIFTYPFDKITWSNKERLFIIGNPPWVTASEIRRMGSDNIPKKSNFKGAKGLDAILGSSNFDICEFIILEMLSAFKGESLTLGMLCKTQVARNVIEYMAKNEMLYSSAQAYRIDAKKWFDASVDACWFVVDCDQEVASPYHCPVYASLDEDEPEYAFGYEDAQLVSNIEGYHASKAILGESPVVWRSGIKHDASKVFEMKESEKGIYSSFGDIFQSSSAYLFPLMKSSDVANGRLLSGKWILVPQKNLADDTAMLKTSAPEVWAYLDSHGDILDTRGSSIYQKKSRFTVFGLGDYTFKNYKVAISGLYKTLSFQLVGPRDGKPVIFDDTCYSIGFDHPEDAALAWALLTSPPCTAFISALSFPDSKRPITKKLLQHIDYRKAARIINPIVAATAEAQRIGIELDEDMLQRSYDAMQ